ncbi:hypothetical protein LguiA_000198 [Lonicera macranthoides]
MDFQQQRYLRPPAPPPPPSMADQHHYQQQQPPPPSQPQQPPWFSGQFQYHPSSQHSPSPPPPHHQQWAPPPPPPPPPQSDHLLPPPPYSTPHAPPYSTPPLHNHQYPPLPPRPQLPPPHPYSHVPQSYPPQPNQEWGNPNWSHHQGWEYPAYNHEEDLAARARAWAAANAATDNQHSQSQFTPVGRPEEQSHYHSQYPQNVDPQYSDVQQSSLPSSNYQQYPSSVVPPPQRTPIGHLQDSASSFSSGYVPDGYLPHDARDGTFPGESNTSFHHRESSSTVHQQELLNDQSVDCAKMSKFVFIQSSPIGLDTGKEEAANQTGKFYNSLPLPSISTPQQHHAQLPTLSAGGSVLMEQPHYAFANQSTELATDLSDQPLDFAPRFARDHDPHMQPNYTHAWTPPPAPGALYPPVIPSGPQVDPAAAVPSSVPGHSAPMFGRMPPGPSFQSAIPSVTASFGMGAGTAVHPSTVFPGDAYGASERTKRASVPNWLREEIIKKKPVITTSAPELSKEETESFEDEAVDKSPGKGDQANSKSVDSSRSTEEEEDDEDYVEAARTAAINQEIKRVLTEVLLKVTDELFDEIATKVLSEHDLTVEVKHNGAPSVHTVSPPTPAVQTPKASAKVLIPAKAKEAHADDVIEKSTSTSPGDVLGLGNYASDEDEDDAIQISDVPNSKGSNAHQKPNANKLLGDIHVHNGSSEPEIEKHSKTHIDVENNPNPGTMSPNRVKVNHKAVVSEVSGSSTSRESMHGEKVPDVSDVLKSKDGVGDKVVARTELLAESFSSKKSISDDSQNKETRNKQDKNDRSEKRSSAGKETGKEDDSGMDKVYEKGDENRKRQDERHARKERTIDQNGLIGKRKEQGLKSGEKAKDADSRKRSTHLDVKDDRKDTQRERRASVKDSSERKRERTKDEKGERSRHKFGSDSSRHKRRRSSSGGNDSTDGSSDDSKRKVRSERRKLSPSPVRSRRRILSKHYAAGNLIGQLTKKKRLVLDVSCNHAQCNGLLNSLCFSIFHSYFPTFVEAKREYSSYSHNMSGSLRGLNTLSFKNVHVVPGHASDCKLEDDSFANAADRIVMAEYKPCKGSYIAAVDWWQWSFSPFFSVLLCKKAKDLCNTKSYADACNVPVWLRQVSRSPHSKHSQRRHSPYSSLETTRGRRLRSRSPVRRQR